MKINKGVKLLLKLGLLRFETDNGGFSLCQHVMLDYQHMHGD